MGIVVYLLVLGLVILALFLAIRIVTEFIDRARSDSDDDSN